jgi:polyvinyl alcohol dehydrogenase (cytochrome)
MFAEKGDPSVTPASPRPSRQPDDAVVAGHLDGFIRIYNSETGDIVWSFDTATSVTGTNGVIAKGGSMSGSGPALGEGHLVINSGYGLYNHEAGNALLVFAPPSEESLSQR